MDNSGYGQVPGRISGHAKAKKRPNTVVVKGRNEHSGGAASSKNIGPCSLIQSVVDVVNVTVFIRKKQRLDVNIKQNRTPVVIFIFSIEVKIRCYLAQAISCMTDPNRRKVQLNASPTAFQYGPSNPSSTSNH